MKASAIVVLAVLLASGTLASPQPASSSHEDAVKEMFKLMGLEQTMRAGSTTMIDAHIQGNPAIAPFRDVLINWSSKYLTWETMAPPLLKLYMETFTEAETRELNAFYRTSTGKKALEKMPELMQKGAAIGMEVAKAHQAELETMLLERQKQLEAENQP